MAPSKTPQSPGETSAPATPPGGRVARTLAKLRGLGLVGFYALFASTFPLIGTAIIGGLLVSHQDVMARWVAAHPVLAPAAYCVSFVVLAGLAILPTAVLSVIGGWALGFAAGFPTALAGYMGAALLGFQLSRRAAGQRVVELIRQRPKWRRVYVALLAGENWRTLLIIALLRLPPYFPFAPMNVLFAAAGVRRRTFLLGSFLGMAPRTAVVIYICSGLKKLDLRGDLRDNWLALASLALTVLAVAVISLLVHRALHRLTAPADDAAGDD